MLSDCFDGRLGVITGVRIEKNSIGFLGFYFILLRMVVLGPTHFFFLMECGFLGVSWSLAWNFVRVGT